MRWWGRVRVGRLRGLLGLAQVAATVFVVLVFASPASAASNLLINGGFDTGEFSPWEVFGPGGASVQCNNPSYPAHSPPCAAVFFSGPTTINQNFSMIVGESYTLDFWLSLTGGGGPQDSFSATWDGNDTVYSAPTDPASFAYRHVVISNLTATGPQGSISFSGTGQNAGQYVLDDVSVVPSPRNRLLSRPQLQPQPDGSINVTVKPPGPGTVNILVTAWKDNFASAARLLNPAPGRFVFARAHATAPHAGTVRILVTPNARGHRLVTHHRYRVTLRLWISYTPTHGRQRDIGHYGLHLP